MYKVFLNEVIIKASCSCKKYEYSEVLCSHILRVFDKLDILKILNAHIMKRWTEKAKEGEVFYGNSTQLRRDYNDDSLMRYQGLYPRINKIAKHVSNDAEVYKLVMNNINAWEKNTSRNKK